MTEKYEMKSEEIKHLEFIQNVVTRLAGNSFLIKGWTITIVTALLALSAKNKQVEFLYFAFIPVLMFWLLDTFYLHQERLFRKHYENVFKKEEIPIFSMDISYITDKKKREKFCYPCFFRKIPFFGKFLDKNCVHKEEEKCDSKEGNKKKSQNSLYKRDVFFSETLFLFYMSLVFIISVVVLFY